MDEFPETSIKDLLTPTNVIVVAAFTYSAYHLTKLGVDWAREGVRTLKAKKNPTA